MEALPPDLRDLLRFCHPMWARQKPERRTCSARVEERARARAPAAHATFLTNPVSAIYRRTLATVEALAFVLEPGCWRPATPPAHAILPAGRVQCRDAEPARTIARAFANAAGFSEPRPR